MFRAVLLLVSMICFAFLVQLACVFIEIGTRSEVNESPTLLMAYWNSWMSSMLMLEISGKTNRYRREVLLGWVA